MRLLVLDKDFEILGDVSLFQTLIWTRRYKSLGMYELHVTKDKFPLINSGKYLYRNDADELGLIEESHYSIDDKGTREIYCKGYFAEKMLEDRVLTSTFRMSGNLEEAFRSMVTEYAISPVVAERKIANLKLGDLSGLAQNVDCQRTGASVSEALYDVGNSYDVSHRVRYAFQTNDLLFEVWRGKDRRDSQTENSWAVFSDSFFNIRNTAYNRNSAEYKNFAYVAGEGEGTDRVAVTVDLRNEREDLRELYVDARDLARDDGEGNITPMEKYQEQLRQRGREKLTEHRLVETVSGDADLNANLVYRKDFDLGDLCTYVNTEIGVITEKRITEIVETYEGGRQTLDIVFGDDEASTIKQLIRKEA